MQTITHQIANLNLDSKFKTQRSLVIFWFRRDLRLNDNHGLSKSLSGSHSVLPIFIFDSFILGKLQKNDARVSAIYQKLREIKEKLRLRFHSDLAILYGDPLKIFEALSSQYMLHSVYANEDYEPYARHRDTAVHKTLNKKGSTLLLFKDQVIFEKSEIKKSDGSPYVVFTPFQKAWKKNFDVERLQPFAVTPYADNFIHQVHFEPPLLSDIGFESATISVPNHDISHQMIQNYAATRDYPALANGTSLLGFQLRFGTLSIRELVQKAFSQSHPTFWSQLIWREFFMQILWHFPQTQTQAFKPKYDRIIWRNNEEEFNRWSTGMTGYPLVDAGMRQLLQTGYMHNRVRMLTASFLCKHLLIDWRWGEAFFAAHLLDYEMASNVGNWQWAAGTGVDAAPYFRIFNPIIQLKKFDPEKKYVRTWIKDLETRSYPDPIVVHQQARLRCLETYKSALKD